MTRRVALGLLALVAALAAFPAGASAEQSSQPASPAAGFIAAGFYHTCAAGSSAVRCWGYGGDGALGYANTDSIGDDETPGSAGPVDFGPGRTVKAIGAGSFHTCAILDDATVRCWGFNGDGRLGYPNTASVGISQAPGAAGPVDLGPGRTAKAISAGSAHTCAVLDDGSVRCWGSGFDGRLGYGNAENVGDVRTPGSVEPVDLGPDRTARAISAGGAHTCALLDDSSVRCWGSGGSGRLGYANTANVGDGQTPTGQPPNKNPGTVGPVDLAGHTATAISAGGSHTCAVLDDSSVRCWGFGGSGRLGYGNRNNVGDNQTPGSVGPVDLGSGRTAKAISAGVNHTCAVLDDSSVRCWGSGDFGQLGYASTNDVGDSQTPGSVGPVDLGPGRTATALDTGDLHTCALLDDAGARCWGLGDNGQLGYCNRRSIGDDETPGSVGPVDLGTSRAGCPSATGAPGATSGAPTGGSGAPGPGTSQPVDVPASAKASRAQTLRALKFGGCLAAAGRRAKRDRTRARTACTKRHGRAPGRVTRLSARAVSRTKVILTFTAPGSDGPDAPAARAYLVKQSGRPLRRGGGSRRAQTLCKGSCRFSATAVGARIHLTVTGLRPRSTYYYTIAARDNVSNKLGPRSETIRVRTR